MAGINSGMVITRMRFHLPMPLVAPASSSSQSTVDKAPEISRYLDADGDYLDGGKNYKLNLPGDAPAEQFMSVVVYDSQTRSMLQTSQPYPSKNNKRDELLVNDDGSIDIYFGPEAPEGKEANWI
jgi:hypothetical protein